ncbi:MAG TPA: tRNA (N6-threonylcarbamoyladenosine(37)-N6)-methyltransferase TrmO [Methermicoccus shengliensis]|uniref:tRNA (N6-threonylcarbamoyladenosine(37)-N6)-methyltransferase TrmO n=2 Tax=Methermicoccus shengliensis TaxID=660064 RepID=A0A832VY45_9EURY|nr:tRNA (N6-threonylcarbamoyladenosine(37)-N6)-methyltransferase TrmO [Methermicoccus shengliensis]
MPWIVSLMHLVAIGVVHTPYRDVRDAPHQGALAGEEGALEVFEQYAEGLKDIEQCSHLIVLYWQHRSRRDVLLATPPHDRREHGVFATRSPHRPNPIGLCVVELLKREGTTLRVRGLDALDGSPLIDIKPYSARADCVPHATIGWLEE